MGKVIYLNRPKTMPELFDSLPENSRGRTIMSGNMAFFSTEYIPFSKLWELLPEAAKLDFTERIKEKQSEENFYEVFK